MTGRCGAKQLTRAHFINAAAGVRQQLIPRQQLIRTYLKIGSRFKAVIPASNARRESF
jgi:hypothetical protein